MSNTKTTYLMLILYFSVFWVILSIYGLVQSSTYLGMLGTLWFILLGIYLELFVIAYKYLSEDGKENDKKTNSNVAD